MDGVVLVASTCPSGQFDTSTLPQALWCETTSEWSVPGRFAFFAFQINLPWHCSEWFPGLELHTNESSLIVGGTVDKWSSACYALLNTDSPHDIVRTYRSIYNILSDFGYTMQGVKSAQHKKFYLK